MRQKARLIRHFLSRRNTDYQNLTNPDDPHFAPPKYDTLIASTNDPNASKHFWVPQFPGRHKKHINDVSFLAVGKVGAAKAPAGTSYLQFWTASHPRATSFTTVGFPWPREEDSFRVQKIETLKPGLDTMKQGAKSLLSGKETLPEVAYEEDPKHAIVSRPSNEQWGKMNSFRRESLPLNTPAAPPEEDKKGSFSVKSLAKSLVPIDLGGGGSDCDGDERAIPGKCSPVLIPANAMRSSRFSKVDLNPVAALKNMKNKFFFPTLNRYEMTIVPTPLRPPHVPLDVVPAGGVDPICAVSGSRNGMHCSMEAAQNQLKKNGMSDLHGEAEVNLRAIHKRNLAFKNAYDTDSVPITITRRIPMSTVPQRDTPGVDCVSRCHTSRCRAVCERDAEWNNFWKRFDQVQGPAVGNYARREFGFLGPRHDEDAVSWGCRYSRETEDQQSFFDKLLNSIGAFGKNKIPVPPPARCNSGHLPDFPLDHHFGDVPALPEMIHL
eukprot:GEMP01017602.1.p1 GENE.GEMP01017602.1~~GEMP01017602.1.p1  ORF type:complete len:493 (+),score=99.84 GEMP01017602.1:713-2191(+)